MSQPNPSTDELSPCDQYQALWSQGLIPDLAGFLAARAPLKAPEMAAVLRVDQAHHWSLQDRLASEDYLQRFPLLAQDGEAAIDLIYAEFLLRKKYGPEPSLHEFLTRFPQHAALLEPQLQLDLAADSMLGGSDVRAAIEADFGHSADQGSTESSLPTTQRDGRQFSAKPSVHNPGERPYCGSYRLLHELGRGGMGAVWEAESLVNGRRVAIKLVSRTVHRDSAAAELFIREAQLAASISHPRSAFVLEAGWHDDQPYLVMELMPGKTLRSLVAQGPIPVAQAIDHILDALEGLRAAHARGILHRDVKPANCFVDSDGRIKIGDYGLAQSLVESVTSDRFVGTLAFASPEQLRTEPLDERSDQYSLGATLYFLLARRPPFAGRPTAVIAQVAADPPPRLAGAVEGVPADLERVLFKSLAKNPAQRYASLLQFRQALLPFSSRGTFLANVGRRLAAYALDDTMLILLSFALFVVTFVVLMVMRGDLHDRRALHDRLAMQQYISALLFSLLGAIYFTFAEGWWGAGLGKRLLRLRVVGPDGGAPGLARSALRIFFIPLACGWTLLDPYLLPRPELSLEPLQRLDLQQLMFTPMLWGTLSYIPVLIVLLPMMFQQSTRGLHDRASGTRVLQLVPAAEETTFVPRRFPDEAPAAASYGPYQVVSQQLSCSAYTSFEGYDALLRRRARIVVYQQPTAPGVLHRGAARPTRSRWLQGGSDWDAFELPDGAPLLSRGPIKQLDWERARQLLLDLAEELAAARREGSLPDALGLPMLFHTAANRLILCDIPLMSMPDLPVFQGPQRDWDFFQQVVATGGTGSGWPSHALEFCSQVRHAGHGPNAIDWAVTRLKETLRRPATIRWDDRLGVMCLAIVAQAWLIPLLIVFWCVQVTSWESLDSVWRFMLAAFPAVASPGLACLVLGRGPLMHFLGITLRTTRGRPVDRWRFCCRNILAWLPWSASWVLFGWSLAAISTTSSVEQLAENDALGLMRAPGIMSVFVAAFLPLLGLLPAGLIALRNPSRSLAERLTGTRLVYE